MKKHKINEHRIKNKIVLGLSLFLFILFIGFTSATINTTLFNRAYLWDDSGNLLLDSSGHYNASNSGATYSGVTKVVGGSINATSTTNSQRAISIGTLTNQDMKTINMWIYSTGTNTKFFYGKNDGASNYITQLTASQYPYSLISSSAIYNSSVILNASWNMITLVQNKTTPSYQWILYFNGSQVGFLETASAWTTATYIIGGLSSDANTGYAFYDDFIISNESWTKEDVMAVYKNYTVEGRNVYNMSIPAPIPSINNISFISQNPSNITSQTLFSQNINVTFKYINESTSLTNISLNYSLSGNLACVQIRNNSCLLQNNTFMLMNYTSIVNTSNSSNATATLTLTENIIYPFIENIPYANSLHSLLSLGANDVVKTKIEGFNTSFNNFYIFETMTNVSVGGNARILVCNSSYVSGDVNTNINCQEIGNINTTGFNHTHTINVSHNLVPFSIQNGKINGGISASSTLYFVVSRTAGTVYNWYTATTTTATTTETSVNKGITYSSQTYTLDQHLHFYPVVNNLYFNYAGIGYFNGTFNSSTFRNELIDFEVVPPSPPIILSPFNTNQSSNLLNITWLNSSINFPNANISHYSLFLLNNDFSINRSILSSIGNNFSYYDPNSVTNLVNAFDNNMSTYAEYNSSGSGNRYLGKYFNNMFVSSINVNLTYRRYSTTNAYQANVSLELYNGSDWYLFEILDERTLDANTDIVVNKTVNIGQTIQGYRLNVRFGNANSYNIKYYEDTSLDIPNYYSYDLYYNNVTIGDYYLEVCGIDILSQSSCDSEFFNLSTDSLLNITMFNTTNQLSNVSVNLTDFTTNLTTSYNTSSDRLELNVIKGRTYNVFALPPIDFAYQELNKTINVSYETAVFYVVSSNSVNITIRDEDSLALITQNVSIRAVKSGTALEYNYATATGNIFVSGLVAGVYTFTLTSTTPISYGSRSYTVTINDRSTQSLDTTLAQSTFEAGYYIRSESGAVITGATFNIKRLVNGSYVTVGTGTTDVLGYVVFTQRNGNAYKYLISASGFDTREFLFTPYVINSPYTFTLSRTASNPFFNIFDYVSYNYAPKSTVINQSYNSFSLTSFSINGTIIYTYIRCGNQSANITGSPSGSTATVYINTTNYSSSYVNCFFEFQYDRGTGNFTPIKFNFNRTYNILGISPNGSSIKESAETIKDEVNNLSWMSILSYLIIIVGAGLISGWTQGNKIAVAGFVCLGIITFSAVGWIDPLIGGIVAFVGLMLLFMGGRN